MKKLVIIIILAMLAKYLYQQPEFKSWADTQWQTIWSDISGQFTRPAYKDIKRQLLLLENQMSTSEQQFLQNELQTPEQTRAFFQNYCGNYQSMHRILTDSNRQLVCTELAKYYQPR